MMMTLKTGSVRQKQAEIYTPVYILKPNETAGVDGYFALYSPENHSKRQCA